MADRVSTFVHWLITHLFKNPTGVLRMEINKGNLGKVTWYDPEQVETGTIATPIDLDDPFLSKYMPRLNRKILMDNGGSTKVEVCEDCNQKPCVCFAS